MTVRSMWVAGVTRATLLTSAAMLWTSGAAAQATPPTAPPATKPAPQAPAPPETGAAPSQPAAEPEPAAEDVSASPDVQKQVNLKTEKVEDEPEPSTTVTPSAQPTPQEQAKAAADDPYGHALQGGVRVGFVPAFRTMFRYPETSPPCNGLPTPDWEGQQKICSFFAPPAMEIAGSFAITDSIEPYVFVRFGLGTEEHTATESALMGGLGARIYANSSSRFKVFFEPALGLTFEGFDENFDPDGSGPAEATDYLNPNVSASEARDAYKTDVNIHLGVGPQYDFLRYLGAYLNIGVDVSVVRAFAISLMGNVGLQGRFP